ncbi:MAG TPA: hypothetical protein VNF99_01875 [Stellaceae bacterium]|nr:hypothetical protein [Stellaceae bacterium]
MGRRDAALPSSFSLLKSEFNDFLFAPIGAEDDAGALTVLSAFSRQGIDPWQQAARLRQLPKDVAAQNLASIIAALPGEPRSLGQSQAIADQLIALLPRRPSPQARLTAAMRRLSSRLARPFAR